MTTHRINGIITGLFYIIAAVTSIIAVVLYQPILAADWYLVVQHGLRTSILIGIINDLLLVATALGTALMLFPYLRHWNERIALGHLMFRFMEAVMITIGLVGILGLLTISDAYANGLATSTGVMAIGEALQGFHKWTFILGPNLMLGINTLCYSYLFFKSRILPRSLAAFGMLTAVMVFISGVLDLFGLIGPFSTIKLFIALPVGVYEMILAFWLIFKGFDAARLEALINKDRSK